jgi:hypothetical protein
MKLDGRMEKVQMSQANEGLEGDGHCPSNRKWRTCMRSWLMSNLKKQFQKG